MSVVRCRRSSADILGEFLMWNVLAKGDLGAFGYLRRSRVP